MLLKEVAGRFPSLGKNVFVAETAVLAGDVAVGDDCSIWYGAVLRGDVGRIELGDRVNVQDGVVIHATHGKSSVKIGNDVSIGHNAIVHGAVIGNNVLVGMGAVVMDNAVVPDGTVVAAGAVVLSGTRLEPGIYAGVPAKKIREGSEDIVRAVHENALNYVEYKKWFE